MKTLKNILWSVALVCALPFFAGCEKPQVEEPEIKALATPVVTATLDGLNVELEWDAIVNATSYKVEYKKESETEYTAAGSVNYSPYVVEGLELDNTYDFRVKALNGDVESEWSEVVSVKVEKLLAVPAPTFNTSISFIEVKWEAVEGAESYRVEYKLSDAAEYTEAYNGNGEDTEFKVKIGNLEGSTSYDVRMSCLAEGFSETFTDVFTLTTTAAPSNVIRTADEFIAWLKSIDGLNEETVALGTDIDMTGKTITSATGFAGTLEGQGYAIKNLKSDKPLFEKNSGTIRDLVIDATCEFTVKNQKFGALVADDLYGKYYSVVNNSTITYKATADVTDWYIIGGIVGVAKGSNFTDCANNGTILYDATGYTHVATSLGGIAGLVDAREVGAIFTTCENNGPLSIKAKYGIPRITFMDWSNGHAIGINIGGITGSTFGLDYAGEEVKFESCYNKESGTLYLYHTETNLVPDDNNTGFCTVAGIVGSGGTGSFNKCQNLGLLKADCLVSGTPAPSSMKRRNYLIGVGGIVGYGWDSWKEIASCQNKGNIEVEYYGTNNSSGNYRACVGGIMGCTYKNPSTPVNYCKMKGDITVRGNGSIAVGGISGFNCKQIKNEVTSDVTINVVGNTPFVGGLTGFISGAGYLHQIKGCTCAATIIAETTEPENSSVLKGYASAGGLLGRWEEGKTESTPCFIEYDGDPCVFKGSISSTTLGHVGLVMGVSNKADQVKVFGSAEYPIQILNTVTIAKKGTEAVAVSPSNVEELAIALDAGNTTCYVTCPNN